MDFQGLYIVNYNTGIPEIGMISKLIRYNTFERSDTIMDISTFQRRLEYLTCRRIIEENHENEIIGLIEEKGHNGICRYVASISPLQVNIYDCMDTKSGFGFFAHYVVEKTEYFKGGECNCGCWLYPTPDNVEESIVAVGTTKGEIFLLSCIECRVISILTTPFEQRITRITTSPAYPNLLIAINSLGNMFVWDIKKNALVYQFNDIAVYDLVSDGPSVILYLGNTSLAIMDLTTFIIRSIQPITSTYFKGQLLLAMEGDRSANKWILLFPDRMVYVHQQTLQVEEVHMSLYLPDYITPSRVFLTHNQELLCITDRHCVHILNKKGEELGMIMDNYGVGAQNNKDQNPYRRLPLTAAVIHPEANYAVAIENNRVLHFNMLNPTDRYVSHVIFPHPVEDMFIFYNSLNAEPLMYLHPKVKKNNNMLRVCTLIDNYGYFYFFPTKRVESKKFFKPRFLSSFICM